MDPEGSVRQVFPLKSATTSFNFSFVNKWLSRKVLRDEIYFRINQAESPTTLNGPIWIWIDRKTGPPPKVKVYEGQKYIFNCSFRGLPKPTPEYITWTYNGDPIAPDDPLFTIFHGDMETHLIIEHARKEHVGTYGCQVGNYLGDYDYRYNFTFVALSISF